MFLYVFRVMDPDLEITKSGALSPRKIEIRIRHVQIRILIKPFFKGNFFLPIEETLSVDSDVHIHRIIFFRNGEKKQF